MPIVHAHYQRFETAAVADLVEHAWVVRDATPGREVLLPDGRGLLQVVLGGPSWRIDPLGGTREPDVSGVRGLTTRAVVRESAARRGPARAAAAPAGRCASRARS